MPKNGTQNFVHHRSAKCASWRIKIDNFHALWRVSQQLLQYPSRCVRKTMNPCRVRHKCAYLPGAIVTVERLATSAHAYVPHCATRYLLGSCYSTCGEACHWCAVALAPECHYVPRGTILAGFTATAECAPCVYALGALP